MTFPELLTHHHHEQLLISQDPGANYLGIVAIHDTTLGPALGGTRLWNYASLDEALVDALRLARGMTYKSAMAGLPLGGGKAVIVGDPRRTDREACFRSHGRFINTLGGRYISAADVGTSGADMELIRLETPFVSGLPDRSGDSSILTAFGVYMGMKAAARVQWGSDCLARRTVLLQGAGKVATHLASLLAAEGASIKVSDIEDDKVGRIVRQHGATAVAPGAVYGEAADIYAPCALGATLNDATIAALKAQVVCGGANNQLAEPRHAAALAGRGILYVPDYVANAGGVINICREVESWSEARARASAEGIYQTVLRVVQAASEGGMTTAEAADRLAEERIAAVRAMRPLSSLYRPPARP
jgi:leucine dehydrogenase